LQDKMQQETFEIKTKQEISISGNYFK